MPKRERTETHNRIWSISQVAAYMGHSDAWFRDNREVLELYGFPKPTKLGQLVLGWDGDAIKLWMDRRSEIVKDVDDTAYYTALVMERMANGGNSSSIS